MFDRAGMLERYLAEPWPVDEVYPPYQPPDDNLVDAELVYDTRDPALFDHHLPVDEYDWEPHPDDLVELACQVDLGPRTFSLLTATSPHDLSPAARSAALSRITEYESHVAAVRLEIIGAIAGAEPVTPADRRDDFAPQEVAIAARCSVYAADAKIAVARRLNGRWHATREAMRAGDITESQTRSMIESFDHLDEPLRKELEANMLKYAHRQSPANFRRSLTRWLAKKDPTWTARAERERREATVHHQPNDDGTGDLHLRGPLEATAVIDLALEACAARSKDELGGTKDQRKLAALRDWADGVLTGPSAPSRHGIPTRVDIVLQGSTMLGLDDQPAEIPGVGGVPASAAFWAMADGAEVRCLLVEKGTGRLKAIDPTVYRVPPAIAELLIKRYQSSAGPHSTVAASGCDMEHNTPHAAGGATDPINVTPVDRRWHRPKTHAGWTYTKDPATDIVTWTSPISGLTCQIDPYDYLLGP